MNRDEKGIFMVLKASLAIRGQMANKNDSSN
jgi:hypothetical protein